MSQDERSTEEIATEVFWGDSASLEELSGVEAIQRIKEALDTERKLADEMRAGLDQMTEIAAERLRSEIGLVERVRKAELQNVGMREALKKYADKTKWDDGGFDREEAKVIFCEHRDRAGYVLAQEALSTPSKTEEAK